jgi:hypothetical protein
MMEAKIALEKGYFEHQNVEIDWGAKKVLDKSVFWF